MSRRIRQPIAPAAILLAVLLAMPSSARSTTQDARAFVSQLGNEAQAILQPSVSSAERATRMEALLRKAFDFDAIARSVAGRFWNRATPQQQAEYQRVFGDFVVQSYSRQLGNETMKGFQVTGAKDVGDHDVIVDTAIDRPDGPPLRYGWRVREDGGSMKLVDVLVEGVSMTVTHRADFATTFEKKGMEGIIAALKQKAATGTGG